MSVAPPRTTSAIECGSPEPEFAGLFPHDQSRSEHLTRLSLGVCVGLCLLFISGYELPGSNHAMQIPQIMAMQDPELYKNDYFVQEMTNFTPRTYYKWAIYLVSRVGFGIPTAYLLTYTLAFLGYVSAAYAIGNAIARSPLAGAITAFFAVQAHSFTIGGNAFFRPIPFPMMYAVPFALWGVYHCYRTRFALGYFLFGVATLFHFIGGTLSALLLVPALAYSTISRKQYFKGVLPLALFGLLAAAVYVPMVMTASTSSGALTNKAFIELYGTIRHPHHIIPSMWPLGDYLGFASFIALAMLCLAVSQRLSFWHKTIMISAACASILSVVVGGYVLVELVPLATFAKLQFGRSTEVLQLMLLPAIACVALELFKTPQPWLAVPLLLAPLSPNGPLVAVPILAVVLWRTKADFQPSRETPVAFALCAIASVALFASASTPALSFDLARNWFFYVGSAAAVLAPTFLFHFVNDRALRTAISVGLASLTVAAFLAGAGGVLPGKAQSLFDRRLHVWRTPLDEPGAIAMRFSQSSDRNAVVLVPPTRAFFRLYSQRAVVADWKAFPYTDRGMVEWKQRMEDLVGVPLDRSTGRKVDSHFSKRTESDLLQVAAKYGATHILTRWHKFDNAVVHDREGPWVLYELSGTERVPSP